MGSDNNGSDGDFLLDAVLRISDVKQMVEFRHVAECSCHVSVDTVEDELLGLDCSPHIKYKEHWKYIPAICTEQL